MNRLSSFRYKAVQANGKMRHGVIMAVNQAEAFAKLRADNLSPLSLKASSSLQKRRFNLERLTRPAKGFNDLELEHFLQSLAVLLRAGSDIRTALSVLGDEGSVKAVAQKIAAGSSLDAAIDEIIPTSFSHLRGLIAAGEARGDLASGLDGAAKVLETRRKIRQQMFEALSYPVFVFLTAIGALSIILLVVVPAIAPLLEDTGSDLPLYFKVIIALSDGLQYGWPYVLMAFAVTLFSSILGWRFGRSKAWFEKWLLAGPLKSICLSLVFGGYAKTLGQSLQSGANLLEALRLCQRSVGNSYARQQLEAVTVFIRQGRSLSEALRQIEGMPKPIIKLCEVGEASSALGPMLARAGEREEQQALSRIDRIAKILGPLLIVFLGALIGLLMAGVLTALTDIGSVSGA
jgi:general secretion pathway protein F